MAEWERKVMRRTTVEYAVTAPVPYGELLKALRAAEIEAAGKGIDTSRDDWCEVQIGDGRLIVVFEVTDIGNGAPVQTAPRSLRGGDVAEALSDAAVAERRRSGLTPGGSCRADGLPGPGISWEAEAERHGHGNP